MKRISLFTLLCLIAIPVLAEQVSVVTFNPSRLGEYQHLKVTDSATLRGGLSTPRFEVGAGAAVLLDNQTTDKQVLFGDIVGGQGNPGNRGEMTINMPQALFRKGGDIFRASYIASHAHNPNANLLLPQINAVGGRMEFTNDSFVNNLTRQITGADPNDILLQANQLDVSGDMEVTGRGIVQVLGADGNLSGSLTNVFQLGEYKIPYPTTVQHRSGDNRSLVTLYPATYANFNLAWVERKKAHESGGSSVYVLSLVGQVPCEDGSVISEERGECEEGYEGYTIKRVKTTRDCSTGAITEVRYEDANGNWTLNEEDAYVDISNCVRYCWVVTGMGDEYQAHFAWNKKQWAETECSAIRWGTFRDHHFSLGYSIYVNQGGGTMSCSVRYHPGHNEPADEPFAQCIQPDPNNCDADHVGWTNYGLMVIAANYLAGMQCNPGGFGKKTNFVCMRRTQDQGPSACANFPVQNDGNAMVVTYH